MRAKFVVLITMAIFAVAMADVDLNQIFEVSVEGSFEHNIPNFVCTSCDCTKDDGSTPPDPSKPNVLGPPPCSIWETNVDSCDNAGNKDQSRQRWGKGSDDPKEYNCFSNSGIGFQGYQNIIMQANSANSTNIGRMSHYNNAIQAPSPTKLQLYIKLTSPQLSEAFETIFPLSFIETTNHYDYPKNLPAVPRLDRCDSSIQRTSTPCDDRFSFDAYIISRSFVSNNIRYTLQVTGFIQFGGTKPISQFVTEERKITRSNVFAKIVTFCEEVPCGVNQVFEGAPTCECVCALTNKTCRTIFGPRIAVDEEECTCACAETETSLKCNASNPDIGAFNPDSCSCGCELTHDDCKEVNPLFEVSMVPGTCACVCNRQRWIDCRTTNTFFIPAGPKCLCVCGVTDEICEELFGDNYKADTDKCSCFIPGSDTGLTDEEIAVSSSLR